MKTYNAALRGEDGTEFVVSVTARNLDNAYDDIIEDYPEAKVLEIFEPSVRAEELYHRVSRDSYYDY
jgi:hypothetical protein